MKGTVTQNDQTTGRWFSDRSRDAAMTSTGNKSSSGRRGPSRKRLHLRGVSSTRYVPISDAWLGASLGYRNVTSSSFPAVLLVSAKSSLPRSWGLARRWCDQEFPMARGAVRRDLWSRGRDGVAGQLVAWEQLSQAERDGADEWGITCRRPDSWGCVEGGVRSAYEATGCLLQLAATKPSCSIGSQLTPCGTELLRSTCAHVRASMCGVPNVSRRLSAMIVTVSPSKSNR